MEYSSMLTVKNYIYSHSWVLYIFPHSLINKKIAISFKIRRKWNQRKSIVTGLKPIPLAMKRLNKINLTAYHMLISKASKVNLKVNSYSKKGSLLIRKSKIKVTLKLPLAVVRMERFSISGKWSQEKDVFTWQNRYHLSLLKFELRAEILKFCLISDLKIVEVFCHNR